MLPPHPRHCLAHPPLHCQQCPPHLREHLSIVPKTKDLLQKMDNLPFIFIQKHRQTIKRCQYSTWIQHKLGMTSDLTWNTTVFYGVQQEIEKHNELHNPRCGQILVKLSGWGWRCIFGFRSGQRSWPVSVVFTCCTGTFYCILQYTKSFTKKCESIMSFLKIWMKEFSWKFKQDREKWLHNARCQMPDILHAA